MTASIARHCTHAALPPHRAHTCSGAPLCLAHTSSTAALPLCRQPQDPRRLPPFLFVHNLKIRKGRCPSSLSCPQPWLSGQSRTSTSRSIEVTTLPPRRAHGHAHGSAALHYAHTMVGLAASIIDIGCLYNRTVYIRSNCRKLALRAITPSYIYIYISLFCFKLWQQINMLF